MNRRTRVSRATGLLTGAALLVSGAVLMTAPPVVPEAQAATPTLPIDEPLQTETNNWDLDGAGNYANSGSGTPAGPWTPLLTTVSQNNTFLQSEGIVPNCGDGAVTGKTTSSSNCKSTPSQKRDSKWLTLTTDNANQGNGQAGTALLKDSFSSALGIVLDYDQRVYRTNNGMGGGTMQGGGDGIAVYLADANPPNYDNSNIVATTGDAGGYGAGLGYSSVSGNGNAWCQVPERAAWEEKPEQGVAGGYIGVGFDVYGNYQKAEKLELEEKKFEDYPFDQRQFQDGFNRLTRPYLGPNTDSNIISGANGLAFEGLGSGVHAARIPQSIGLRGSGVRYTDGKNCTLLTAWDTPDTNSMREAYGQVAVSSTYKPSNPGYVTVYQVKWNAGDNPSNYHGQYSPDGTTNWQYLDAVAVTNPPAGLPYDSRGYVQWLIPASTGSFYFIFNNNGTYPGGSENNFGPISKDSYLGHRPDFTPLTGTSTWEGGYRWLAGTPNLSTQPNLTTTDAINASLATTQGAVIDNVKNDSQHYRKVRVTVTPKLVDGNYTSQIRVFWTQKLDVADDKCYYAPGHPNAGDLIPGDFYADGTTDTCVENGGIWSYDKTKVQQLSYQQMFAYDMKQEDGQATLPANFKLGFSASTGYAVNYHQIRNVQVNTEIDPGISKKIKNIPAVGEEGEETGWDDEVTTLPGDQVEYKLGLYNNGPDNVTAAFPVALADGLGGLPLTNLSWCATASSSGHFRTGGTSGTWQNAKTRPANYCDKPANWTPGGLPQDFVWYANKEGTPSSPVDQVNVYIKGSVTNAASGKTWTNTATITPDKRGPQDSNLLNNYDSAKFTAPEAPRWTVEKKAERPSGQVVSANEFVTYTVTGTVTPNDKPPVMDSQTVYVKVDKIGTGPTWAKAYMNYAKGECTPSSGWTPLPGQEMTKVTVDGVDYWMIEVTGTEAICATFTDGNGAWLNNNGENIQIAANAGYSTVTQNGTTNTATVVDKNPSGKKWGEVNTSSKYPPVSQPVITDDLSGVLGASPALASYVENSVVAEVDGDTVTPTEVVAPFESNGWHLTVKLGDTTVDPGENVTVEYKVKMSSVLPGGEKIHNIATGNAANGAPSQCATGAVDQGNYTDEENEDCWTEHPTQAQTLTLVKEMDNPDGILTTEYLKPGDWTLTARDVEADPLDESAISEEPGWIVGASPAEECPEDGDDCDTEAATAATPVAAGDYALSETPASGTAPAYLRGDWSCSYPGANPEDDPVTVSVAKDETSGAQTFSMPSGKDVTCKVVNSTAEITLLKRAEGGTAVASDFKLSAKPAGDPVLDAIDGATKPSTAPGVTTALVLPGTEYTLSETIPADKGSYLQKALQVYLPGGADGTNAACPAVADIVADTGWTNETGGAWNNAACWDKVTTGNPEKGQAVVDLEPGDSNIYRFVNAEVTGPTLPLTGGASALMYTVIGLALVGAAVTAEVIRRKKRGSGAHVA